MFSLSGQRGRGCTQTLLPFMVCACSPHPLYCAHTCSLVLLCMVHVPHKVVLRTMYWFVYKVCSCHVHVHVFVSVHVLYMYNFYSQRTPTVHNCECWKVCGGQDCNISFSFFHSFSLSLSLQLFRRVAAALPGMESTQEKPSSDCILYFTTYTYCYNHTVTHY